MSSLSSQKRKFEDISITEPHDTDINVLNEPTLKKRKLIKDDPPKVINTQTDDANKTSLEIQSNETEITKQETKQSDKVEIDENVETELKTERRIIDPYKQYNWESAKIILRATTTFADTNKDHHKYLDGGNFIKSIYWSPNGAHLLSNSNDRILRMFNPFNYISNDNDKTENEMKASVMYKHREPIYDISFYPLFKNNDYSTNVFVTCSRDSPIFMFDSWQNNKRCSYSHLFGDVVVSPYSLTFSSNGEFIFGGYKKYIIQFSTKNPGNQYHKKIKCVNRNNFGQKSIISVMKFMNKNNYIFASGCYDGIAQLFDIRCNFAMCAFKCIDNHNNGITDIQFSPCNNYLLCGQRKGNDIYCWDLRYVKNNYYFNNTFETVDDENNINFNKFNDGNTKIFKDNDAKNKYLCAKYKRNIINNQRVQFDIDDYSGYWIVSGNQNANYCNIYDVNTNTFDVEPKYQLKHDINVKSVSSAQICPKYPFLATAVGQRVLKQRKIPNSDHKDNNNDSNNESESETESETESELQCSNINDICIWDLRFKQH